MQGRISGNLCHIHREQGIDGAYSHDFHYAPQRIPHIGHLEKSLRPVHEHTARYKDKDRHCDEDHSTDKHYGITEAEPGRIRKRDIDIKVENILGELF